MDPTIIIILRIIHIVAGAVWVGGAVTTAFFLLPTVKAPARSAGSSSGRLSSAHIFLSGFSPWAW